MLRCTWIRRIAPALDAAYDKMPPGPVGVVVRFAEVALSAVGVPEAKDANRLRALIRVNAREGSPRIIIDVGHGFDDGLSQVDNVAERILVEAIVSGIAIASGEVGLSGRFAQLVAQICPNAAMRYMHRFQAQSFRDYVRAKVGRKPLLIDRFEHAGCLIGLGWRFRARENGAEVSDVPDCTSYLSSVVEGLIENICEILRQLDRRSVEAALLRNYEAASCDRDVWRRTARANLAMHNNRATALATMVDHDGRLSESFTLSRILLEAAICECPTSGGRVPGRLDLSRLLSLAFLTFSFGGDSDAVYWGAMKPWIRITPLGD